MFKIILILVVGIFLPISSVFSAVGCSLNDPDRDVLKIFPESTGYKTEFITIKERGGQDLVKEIEKRLGDKLGATYESVDVPYAYYIVLKGKEVVGYIHGVNQKGTYGGMQIILATDLEGKIIDFYYQKISSPESRAFRDKIFREQFFGVTLEEFYNQEFVEKLRDPSKTNNKDFSATVRGIKKNLILFDIFMSNNNHNKERNGTEGGRNEYKK